MKISKLVALSMIAAASLPAAAIAQDAPAADAAPATPATGAPSLAAGQTVYGPDGQPAATVVSVDGGNVVIDTGTQKATLPASVFASSDKGPTIAYNKDQLNAAIESANKQAGGAGATATP